MMRDDPEPVDRAIEDRDVTLALSVPQLLAVVAGVFVLVRALKGLRERQMTRTVKRRTGLRRVVGGRG